MVNHKQCLIILKIQLRRFDFKTDLHQLNDCYTLQDEYTEYNIKFKF